MKLLDTVMDAINSLFPDLIRTPTSGSSAKAGGPDGKEEGAGFAATLVQFLGGQASEAKEPDSAGSAESDGQNEDGALGQGGLAGAESGHTGAEPHDVQGQLPRVSGSAMDPTRAFSQGTAEELGDPGEGGARLSKGSGAGTGSNRAISQRPLSLDGLQQSLKASEVGSGLVEEFGSGASVGLGGGDSEPAVLESMNGLVLDGAVDQAGLHGDVEGGPGGIDASAPLSPTSAAGPMDRDLGKLDPEFRARLGRVMERMDKEFGHQVQMVEGYRSPERQAELFQRGRTQPGPVVTWTQDSLHSHGRAADLQIDGSWENPQAYARLQRIAREEGLQTLGAKDAGHLQLSDEGPGGSSTKLSQAATWAEPRGGIPRPARVARVAAPSRAARVARVASPAHLGSGSSESVPTTSVTSGSVEIPAAELSAPGAGEAAAERVGTGDARPTDGQTRTRTENPGPQTSQPTLAGASLAPAEGARSRPERDAPEGRDSARSTAGTQDGSGASTLSGRGWTQGTGDSAQGVRGAEAIQRLGSMERVNEVQALEEALNARMPGRVHLDLTDADGLGTRLRLSLRGSQLGGTVDLTDPAATLRMKDRVGELHQALARQGLDATALSLQAVRGAESARGIETDLAALLQDPLAGLSRILESRNGSLDTRGERQGAPGDEAQKEHGRFRDPAQRDRSKEEEK